MKDRRQDRGVTLVELLVVLAIVSLAVALALPYSARSAGAQRYAAFVQTAAAELRNARMQAVFSNRESVLTIDLDGRTLSLGASGRSRTIPDGIDLAVVTSAGEVRGGSAGFRFFPDGTSTGGRIVVTYQGKKKMIAVSWLTGGVQTTASEVE